MAEFQETALSLERLADIVDHPQELEITGEQKPPIPPIAEQLMGQFQVWR